MGEDKKVKHELVDQRDIIPIVYDWRIYRDDETFEWLWERHKHICDIFAKRFYYLGLEELKQELLGVFFNCLLKFDASYTNPKKEYNAPPSFTGYYAGWCNAYCLNKKNQQSSYTRDGGIYEKNETTGRYNRTKGAKANLEGLEGSEDYFGKEDSDIKEFEFEQNFKAMQKKFKMNDREANIIKMTMDGFKQKEIAEILGISQSRVSVILAKWAKPKYDLREYILNNFNFGR